MHIVANKAWTEKNPAAAKLFAIMQLPVADINAQNAIMHDGKASEGDIQGHVDGWIKAHQQQFDGWVNEALAAPEVIFIQADKAFLPHPPLCTQCLMRR